MASQSINDLALQAAGGWKFTNIIAAGVTTLKTGAGILHGIIINQKGTGTATVAVYDNTTNAAPKMLTLDHATYIGPLILDIAFATGLTVAVAGTTAGDVTFLWK